MASKTTNLENDGVPGRAPLAKEITADNLAADTVLDYLWMAPPEGGSDCATAPPADSGADSLPAQTPGCLESTLKRYSNWLDSIGTD